MKSAASFRCDYMEALVALPSDSVELVAELKQLFVDIMDVTEQSDTGAAVVSAHEAFAASLKQANAVKPAPGWYAREGGETAGPRELMIDAVNALATLRGWRDGERRTYEVWHVAEEDIAPVVAR